jgi:hypothetical protein
VQLVADFFQQPKKIICDLKLILSSCPQFFAEFWVTSLSTENLPAHRESKAGKCNLFSYPVDFGYIIRPPILHSTSKVLVS